MGAEHLRGDPSAEDDGGEGDELGDQCGERGDERGQHEHATGLSNQGKTAALRSLALYGARWSKRYGDTATAAYACPCGHTATTRLWR